MVEMLLDRPYGVLLLVFTPRFYLLVNNESIGTYNRILSCHSLREALTVLCSFSLQVVQPLPFEIPEGLSRYYRPWPRRRTILYLYYAQPLRNVTLTLPPVNSSQILWYASCLNR